MESDTPEVESGELSIDDASAAFASLLDPEKEKPEDEKAEEVDTEVDPKEDEKEPEPNAEEEGADAPLTIEVDGKQVTLTKAEIAEAYKNGLRQADYTQKTMAVAEQRKAAEAETLKAQQERQTYATNLQKMAAQLEGALEQQEKIDWNALRESNPVEFINQWHLKEQRQAALEKNLREQQSVRQQFHADQVEALKAHIATQQEQLLAKLPEWKDAAKMKSERDALKEYLTKEGYDAKDIDGITDHKAVILSRKAMLYDQMMAKAQAAAKKVQNLPTKVERPGTATERNPLDGRTSAMRNHAKEGTIDSLAAAFSAIF